MEDMRITYNSVILYIIIFNTVLGMLFGIFLFLVVFILQKRTFVFYGFVLSIVLEVLTGVLLSFPVALLFVWLILRTPQTEIVPAVDSTPASADPSVNT